MPGAASARHSVEDLAPKGGYQVQLVGVYVKSRGY